ncbi:hypothetical protein [Nocardioides sp. InS609-2]|uniref:hypothetical protein n=1 Tax=Nocardioides sp. InS609-2 TaxID=2760705 RepID=UPI0020C00F29|nr:hypothetical protein [Nocardioides sp. InS609-2]
MASRRTRRNWWTLLVVVVLLNTPLLMSLATKARISSSGTVVTAEVLGGRLFGTEADPEYWLTYRFDGSVDKDREQFSEEVTRATYRAANVSRELAVRVVPSDPTSHAVEGATPRRLGLWITLGADAIVLLVVLVVWLRRRSRPEDVSDPMPDSSP